MIKLWNGWSNKSQGHLLFRYNNIQQRIPTSHHVLSLSLSLSPSLSHTGQKLTLKTMKPYILEGNTLFFLNHISLEKVFLAVTYLDDCFGCYLLIILLRSCCFMRSWQVPHLLTSHRIGQTANRGISLIFTDWLKARRRWKRAYHPDRAILSPSMGYDVQTREVFYFWILNH